MAPSRDEHERGPARDPNGGPGPGGQDPPADRGSELMLLWQGGDEDAFRELVELYSGQVFALLTRFLGRRHAGREDLVQEVFLRVVRARDRYEPTARFSTWLYSIVWRMCINETERRAGRQPLSFDGMGAGDDDAFEPADEQQGSSSDGLERADVVARVREAIGELPETQRIAVVLARYHDLPYSEIAAIVGSTEKAIKSLVHRARETLRARLQPLFESEVA
ncbi:MAG: RNA polymerase sigma factor [Planctomycetota bacterium]